MPTTLVHDREAYYVGRRLGRDARPPVLLLHGAGGSHQHWLYQVRDLASPACAPDLPGHGRSAGSGFARIAAYGDWVVAFLDELDLDRAVIAGHSMGGAIALDVALRYPDRVGGVGLISTGARLPVSPALLAGLRDDPPRTIDLIAKWSFGREVPPEMVEMGREQMGAVPPEVLYGDFAACDAFDVRDRLGEIVAPAAVVCGTHDRMMPARHSAALRGGLPTARLTLVHGAGHMLMIERPGAVTRALARLVESLDLSS
jgi:pimeloyl-ACP methyl ester carboxylesterase